VNMGLGGTTETGPVGSPSQIKWDAEHTAAADIPLRTEQTLCRPPTSIETYKPREGEGK